MPANDPGLAGERTDLAWQRTGLAYVGTGALLLKNVSVAAAGIGFIVVGLLAVTFGLVERRIHGPVGLRALSLAMTALAAVAVVVALT